MTPEIAKHLAKALAFAACGKKAEAYNHTLMLVRLLREAGLPVLIDKHHG